MSESSPRAWLVVVAFASVYVFWGSTYLAILFAIETIPPFLMAGIRFLIAGSLMYAVVRRGGAPRPDRREWAAATIIGGALLLCGNGAVVRAEQRVASGIASLLVATVSFWMILFEWLRPGGERPGFRVIAGLVVGFVGLALLIGPGGGDGMGVDPIGAGGLTFGAMSWAAGSIYARRAPAPASPLMGTAMQMLAGGGLLILAALAVGEVDGFDWRSVSRSSSLAVLYLVVFGSIVGYTAYSWLLRVLSPAKVSTYAYVNPVVAVFLGWAFADEVITPRVLLAAAVILGAVALITAARAPGPRQRARSSALEDGGPGSLRARRKKVA